MLRNPRLAVSPEDKAGESVETAVYAAARRRKDGRQPTRASRRLTRRLRCGGFVRRFVGNPGLGKGRHAGMARKRRAQDQEGRRRAGGFAEPHVEVKERL